jgi:sugar lactone lactonase YvrE
VGVAVDGAGNLYIGDVGAYTHRIVEVTSAGVASVLTITGLVPPLAEPGALTVDAAGNLYIADFNRYVKVTPAGVGSVVATPGFTLGSLGTAKSIAVDAAGTVYLSDSVNNRVLKVTADGAASVVVPADIVPVLNDPAGVSVDGMGNLYIADSGNNRIVEVTTAGIASVVQTPALTSPATLAAPFATAVDNSGNVFVSDSGNNRVVEVSVAGASLAFPNTNVDSSSTAQTATVTNLGDLPLVFSANPSYTLNFSENTGDENLCAASSSLAPGTVCDVSVDFTPQSAGILSASIVATNNNLNNYFDATETVAVSGTGVSTGDMTAVTVSTNPATVILGQRLRSRPR